MIFLLIFSILLTSVMIAYFLRAFDMFVSFSENNITLEKLDSVRLLLLLTKNFMQIIKVLIKKNDLKNPKAFLRLYIFDFSLVVTLLVAIVKETQIAVREGKPSIVEARKKSSILDIVKNAIPLFNDRQQALAFS